MASTAGKGSGCCCGSGGWRVGIVVVAASLCLILGLFQLQVARRQIQETTIHLQATPKTTTHTQNNVSKGMGDPAANSSIISLDNTSSNSISRNGESDMGGDWGSTAAAAIVTGTTPASVAVPVIPNVSPAPITTATIATVIAPISLAPESSLTEPLEAASLPVVEVPPPPPNEKDGILIQYNGNGDFHRLIAHSWSPEVPAYRGMCEDIQPHQNASDASTANKTISVHFTIGCEQMQRDGWSTGNIIEIFYILRLQAAALNVSFTLYCPDANSTKFDVVETWMMGSFAPLLPISDHLAMAGSNTSTSDGSTSAIAPRRPNNSIATSTLGFLSSPVSPERACALDRQIPIGVLYRDMQFRFRTMAIAIMGLPMNDPLHPSHLFAEQHLGWPRQASNNATINRTLPLPQINMTDYFTHGYLPDGFFPYPTAEPALLAGKTTASVPPPLSPRLASLLQSSLDDVALHFRCGDLMDNDHPEYEFNKFSVYAKIISPHARSIGIITSPFAPIIRSNNDTNHTSDDSDDTKRPAVTSTDLQQGLLPDATVQIRAKDSSAYLRARCRVVTTALVDYLQARHPMSRITVHNGPNETVMSSYIRLIMANQTIAGLSSTFGLYPAIASFGTAYLSSPYYNETVPRSRWIVDEFGQANDLDSATSTISQSDKSVVIVQDNERAKVSFIQQLWESEGRAGILAWFQS